jgi:hypothetical protein
MVKLFIIHIIAGLAYGLGGIWALVEFILYLVKDDPFNWWSVALAVAGVVVAILNLLAFGNRELN